MEYDDDKPDCDSTLNVAGVPCNKKEKTALAQDVTVSTHQPTREIGMPVCNGLNGLHGRDCRLEGDLPKCDGHFTGHRGVECEPESLVQVEDVSTHQPAREVGLPVCNGLNGLDGRECRHDGDRPACDGHFTGHRGIDCVAPKADALIMTESAPAVAAPLREIGLPVCNGLNGLNGKECRSETVPTCNGHFTGHRGVDCVPEATSDLQIEDVTESKHLPTRQIGLPVCNGLNGMHGVDCQVPGDLPKCNGMYTGHVGEDCKALAQDVSTHQPAREVGLPVCNGLNGLDGRECRHDGPLPPCDGHFTGHPGVDCAKPALSQAPSVTVDNHKPSHEIGWPVCNGINGIHNQDCRHEGDLPECEDGWTGAAGTTCKPKAKPALMQSDSELFNWNANALIGAPKCNGQNGKPGEDCIAAAQLI